MMSCTDMRYVDPVHRCALQAEIVGWGGGGGWWGGGGGGGGVAHGGSTASGVVYCR